MKSIHLRLTAADKSDVGKQRDQNEDCAYKRIESSEEGDRGLFIVADGMGGYKAGEVASKLAIETISQNLDSFFKPIADQPTIKLDLAEVKEAGKKQAPSAEESSKQKTRKLKETPVAFAVEDQLKTAIQQANTAIIRYGEKQSAARGLGSTVTAVLVQNDNAYVANVGDSRTYLLRAGNLTPVTRDHSLVARLVESNQIAADEIYTHPQRSQIFRSLGDKPNVQIDVFKQQLHPGDILLSCSDGLWEMVRNPQIEQILNDAADPQTACAQLIEAANAGGGEDNISAVVVFVR